MTPLRYKSGPALKYASGLEIEFKATGDGLIAGHGSVFNNVDRHGERVAPGAFTKSLAQLPLPKMLWQHDQQRPIGKWIAGKEDGHGLFLEGQINLKTTSGRDAYEHLIAGDVDGMSIGYREVKAKNEGNVRVLEELALYEVSIVTFPANTAATVATVKNIGSKSELVDLLREVGLPKTAAARVAAGGWPALAGADHQKSATDLAAIIDAATAELRKIR
ncbi:MAG: phage prohead protease, family [Tardiphaga sp.]|nr:phage prohead protease, family [Tardiphaga sp.]